MRLRFELATFLLFLVSIPYFAQVKDFRPVTEAMLRKAAGDWLNWRRTDNAWVIQALDAATGDLIWQYGD